MDKEKDDLALEGYYSRRDELLENEYDIEEEPISPNVPLHGYGDYNIN